MHMIVYTSRAVAGSENCLDEIIAESAKNNPALGVTGALFYENNTYLQVLEGEKGQLQQMMEKIARDPRHQQLKILINESISQRTLEGWAMQKVVLADVASFHELNLELFRDAMQNLVQPNAELFTASLQQVFASPHVDKILLETV